MLSYEAAYIVFISMEMHDGGKVFFIPALLIPFQHLEKDMLVYVSKLFRLLFLSN